MLFSSNFSPSLNSFQMESLDLEASAKSEDDSLSRSSSLIANFRLDEDNDGETRDLFTVVDDPEKHTSTLEAYITFRVNTKVGYIVEIYMKKRKGK